MQQLHTSSSAAFPREQETGGRAAQDGHVRLQHGNWGWETLRQSTGQDECSLRSEVKAVGTLIGNTSLLPQLPQL